MAAAVLDPHLVFALASASRNRRHPGTSSIVGSIGVWRPTFSCSVRRIGCRQLDDEQQAVAGIRQVPKGRALSAA